MIMASLGYKNPLIVNSLYLSPEVFDLDSIDPSRQAFVHVDFVKPGRHTFCVQNDTGEVKADVPTKGPVDRALTFVQG